MTSFYGFKRLAKPEDWRRVASTDMRPAAYELAQTWQAAGGIPPGIKKALDDFHAPPISGLSLDVAIVEMPVFVDTKTAATTDLMGYARNRADEPVVLAVEAKAHEPFGLPVRSWLRGEVDEPSSNTEPHPARERRFAFLCERLGFSVDLECGLRYQLLHRTVSAVMEGELHAAAAVVVLIHDFGESAPGNWKDYELYLDALGFPSVVPGQVVGPALLGSRRSMPTYFLWWQDTPRGKTA
jgi:uncharacterized protein DUF6946